MPRVTCRCGEKMKVPADTPERLDCPKCGARIRVRQPGEPSVSPPDASLPDDGFIRFPCPCGRRLKVRAADRQTAGRCPDCGRVVPIPAVVTAPSSAPAASSSSASTLSSQNAPPRPTRVSHDARTDELDTEDLARLARWSSKFKPLPTAPASVAPAPHTSHHLPTKAEPAHEPTFHPPAGPPPSNVMFEAGMRVCPRCGKPVHMGATNCRECGSVVPRR